MRSQIAFWQDDFESLDPNLGGGQRIYSQGGTEGSSPSICGSSDYFFRTDCNPGDGPDCQGVSIRFAGTQGDYMWRGEDLDGCIQDPDYISFTDIDVSGRNMILFSALFACDDDPNEWEGVNAADGHPDYLRVLYEFDKNGQIEEGLIFRSDASDNANSGDNRGRFRVDTDADGFGDGPTAMGEVFQEFSFHLAAAGYSQVDLKIEAYVNGGGEEFAIDLVTLSELEVVPVEFTGIDLTRHSEGISKLTFTTANEIDCEKYIVQVGDKTGSWDQVGELGCSAAGKYEYLIGNADLDGRSLLRVQQVDLSGLQTYSPTIQIHLLDPTILQCEVGIDFFSIQSPTNVKAHLQLFSLDGILRADRKVEVAQGRNQYVLADELPSGIFILAIKTVGSSHTIVRKIYKN